MPGHAEGDDRRPEPAVLSIERAVRGGGLLLLALSLIVLPSCGRASSSKSRVEAMRVTIAVGTGQPNAPIYVAHEEGFFRDEGLDDTVTGYGSGPLALDALFSGKADFAGCAETALTRAVLDGKAPIVVGTIDEAADTVSLVARKDRRISTAGDLRGKRVGILAGTASDFFLHIFLVTSGVDPKAVTVVPLQPNELVPALLQGRVDALSGFAQYIVQAQDGLGSNAVLLTRPGLYTALLEIVVRDDTARKQSDVVVRFLRAVARAEDFIESHPAEAQAITAKSTGIPEPSVQKGWGVNHFTLALDQTLILALEEESRWMSGKTTPPDFLHYIDLVPLRTVRPDAVTIVGPKG
jgi:ABC-type nitrate/sulfonate/bicarbonate transport system substrate-binding protein